MKCCLSLIVCYLLWCIVTCEKKIVQSYITLLALPHSCIYLAPVPPSPLPTYLPASRGRVSQMLGNRLGGVLPLYGEVVKEGRGERGRGGGKGEVCSVV